MTLADFVRACGTQGRAAREIGVDWSTVHRWLKGRGRPTGQLTLDRLRELGIAVPEKKS